MVKKLFALCISLSLLVSTSLLAGTVERAQFTLDVVDREPVDQVDSLDTSHRQISYFTELKDMQGHTITHQWIYDDQVLFEKSFEVGGPRWRVWSSKTLLPGQTGTWVVNTLDDDRTQLSSQSFLYQQELESQ
jgi:hypothetical protein